MRLTEEEVIAKIKIIRKNNASFESTKALEDLQKNYQGFIQKKINALHPSLTLRDDMVNQSVITLYDAALKFDECKKVKFITYYGSLLGPALFKCALDASTVSKTAYIINEITKVQEFIDEFNQLNRRQPSVKEISDNMNISVNKVVEYLDYMKTTKVDEVDTYNDTSIDPNALLEVLGERDKSEEYKSRQIELIEYELTLIEDMNKDIFLMHIGLLNKKENGKSLTFKEIGEIYGISDEAVRKRYLRTVKQIKNNIDKALEKEI